MALYTRSLKLLPLVLAGGLHAAAYAQNTAVALRTRNAELQEELIRTRAALTAAHESAVASLRRDLVPVRTSALVVWTPRP